MTIMEFSTILTYGLAFIFLLICFFMCILGIYYNLRSRDYKFAFLWFIGLLIDLFCISCELLELTYHG